MLVEGISSKVLQDNAIATLIAGNTGCGNRVYEAKDWPTDPKLFPMLLVHVPRERKVAAGEPGLFQFNTIISLVIICRVVDITAAANVEAALRLLHAEIESTLLGTYAFGKPIQQIHQIKSRFSITSEGKNFIGEMGMTLEVEVFQVYCPNDFVPLTRVEGTVTDATDGSTLAIFDRPLSPPPL